MFYTNVVILLTTTLRTHTRPYSIAIKHGRIRSAPLSLHDALPIFAAHEDQPQQHPGAEPRDGSLGGFEAALDAVLDPYRSEEHTSELQSRENIVCRLLLEKKKKKLVVRLITNLTNNTRP